MRRKSPVFCLDMSVVGRWGDSPDDPVCSVDPAGPKSIPRTPTACRADTEFQVGIKQDAGQLGVASAQVNVLRNTPAAVFAGSHPGPSSPLSHGHTEGRGVAKLGLGSASEPRPGERGPLSAVAPGQSHRDRGEGAQRVCLWV